MAENNAKKYIIKVRGEEVEVSEEVYRAYIRPIRAEQRRKRREWKCSKLSKTGGYYVRCNERCETCPYYQSGNNALGNKLSLDRMAEDGVDLEDPNQDVEARYIEEETRNEEKEKLFKAISNLSENEKTIIKMLYFENKTLSEVAGIFKVSHQAISKQKQKILKKLKLFF